MGLLSTLLGAVISGAPMGPADPYPVSPNGHDPLAALPPAIQQAPVRPPETPQFAPPAQGAPAMQPPPIDNTQDINVTGDAWKPKKETTLGHIYDFLDGKPTYEKKTDDENLKSAMQGFDENPIRTIRRVAKVNPTLAWNMYNQYHDNKIQDDIAKSRTDDETLARASGLLATATPQTYPIIQQRLNKYFEAKGFDPGIPLPDTYDPDAIQGWREGTLKGREQLNYESMNKDRTERRRWYEANVASEVNDRDARTGYDAQRTASSIQHARVREGQLGTEVAEKIRHDKATEAHAAVKEPHVIKTPQGLMELSPSGITGRIGNTIWQKTAPGQWKRIK
jgi:hypothetical protein